MAIDVALAGVIADRIEEVLGSEITQEFWKTWITARETRRMMDQAMQGPLRRVATGPNMPMVDFLGEVIRLAEIAQIQTTWTRSSWSNSRVEIGGQSFPIQRWESVQAADLTQAAPEPIIPEAIGERFPEFTGTVRVWAQAHTDIAVAVRVAEYLNPPQIHVILRSRVGAREHAALCVLNVWRISQPANRPEEIEWYVWDNLDRTMDRLRQQIERS